MVFLDTGYHFAETLGTRDAVAAIYDVTIATRCRSRPSPSRTPRRQGPVRARPRPLLRLRKVEPLERGLAPLRRLGHRHAPRGRPDPRGHPVVGWDAKRDMVKLNPLAAWTDDDIDAYVDEHDVLMNPLLDDGYASIGCALHRAAAREDPRAGAGPARQDRVRAAHMSIRTR